MTNECQKIQALLFVAGEAVSLKDLAALLSVEEPAVQPYLEELQQTIEGQGIALIVTPTHAQLVTSPHVTDYLAGFVTDDASQLSKASSETLSIIAYRGPVSRYDIEAIRGVDSRRILQQLLRRGLVYKIQKAGTTAIHFDVSPEFLQHMGITKKEDLPHYSELSTNENIQKLLANQHPNT